MGPFRANPGPTRTQGRATSVFANACLLFGFAVGSTATGRTATAAETPPRPAATFTLTVWVVDGNQQGLAIALNDLRFWKQPIRYEKFVSDGSGWVPTSLFQILRDLLGKPDDGPVDPFRLVLTQVKPDDKSRNGNSAIHVEFKFAAGDSLVDAWKPLFELGVSQGMSFVDSGPSSPRPDLTTIAQKFENAPGRLHHVGMVPWLGNVRPDLPDWLLNLSWIEEMKSDFKACDESGTPAGITVNRRVVILGPESSDSVPPLWFALSHFWDELKQKPVIITPSATWSALDAAKWRAPNSGAHKLGIELDATYAPASLQHTWIPTISRAMGFMSDPQHLRYATDREKFAIAQATQVATPLAAHTIQYAPSDEELAEFAYRYLIQVLGCRRVGLLYRDTSSTSENGSSTSPLLERRLYGPALRDDFRHWFGDSLIDAAFEKRSTGDASQTRAAWRERLKEQLDPILRMFERQHVDAVGVFGDPREKVPVMEIVRSQLPSVLLFTSEPDWRLESPDPVTMSLTPGKIELGAPANPEYKLNGLLAFTHVDLDRDWIRTQFKNLNELKREGAFLPDGFRFYTAHIVKRLIELSLTDELALFDTPNEPEGKSCVGSNKPCSLACYLRAPLADASSLSANFDKEESASGRSPLQLLLVQSGRFRPLAETGFFIRIVFVGLFMFFPLYLGFLWLERSRGGRSGEGPRRTPTLWSDWIHGGGRTVASRLWRLVLLPGFVFLLPIVALALDALWLKRPVSLSLLPDGYSVFPTLLLYEMIVLLSLYLPHCFDQEIGSQVSSALAGLSEVEHFSLQRWNTEYIENRLRPSPTGWLIILAVATFLTGLDMTLGLPLPMGFTWAVVVLYEWSMLVMVLSAAWVFFGMARAAVRLSFPSPEESTTWQRWLTQGDPDQVRGIGTIFIGAVANALFLFSLLLVARLPLFGLARWRWDIHVGENDLPVGFILYTLAFCFVLGYWFFCYQAFKNILRHMKSARLQALEAKTGQVSGQIAKPVKPSESRATSEAPKAPASPEDERAKIMAITEDPWNPGGSRKAQLALILALAPPVLSFVLGPWGEVALKALGSLIKP